VGEGSHGLGRMDHDGRFGIFLPVAILRSWHYNGENVTA
jgi:hypothetical protein